MNEKRHLGAGNIVTARVTTNANYNGMHFVTIESLTVSDVRSNSNGHFFLVQTMFAICAE